MTTLFNADTSDGLKITSDTSGLIEFQSAGVTKAGVNATGLTGDGSQLTGISGGKFLQVVQTTYATSIATTSASYIDTGLTGSISVTSGNKVLVLGVVNAVGPTATLTGTTIGLFRGATEITKPAEYAGYNTSSTNHTQPVPIDWLDSSPGSGTVTYTLKFYRRSGSGDARVQVDSAMSRLILIEVAA